MSWRRIKRRRSDELFSLLVRTRDKWTCQRCRRYFPRNGEYGQLDCSHYFERGNECTRFDLENCDSLCRGCHDFSATTDGKEWYKEFKIKQFGKKRFLALEGRHYATCKEDEKLARILVKKLIQEYELETGEKVLL